MSCRKLDHWTFITDFVKINNPGIENQKVLTILEKLNSKLCHGIEERRGYIFVVINHFK